MSYTVKELLESVQYTNRVNWEKDVMQKYPHAKIKTANEVNKAPYGSGHLTVHAVIPHPVAGTISVGHFSSTYGSGQIKEEK